MRARLSVVIPSLNAEKMLPRCLSHLMEGLEAGLIRELIITDGGSGDATAAIAEEAGAILLRGDASRGGQLRRGVAAARGEWLLVLHADSLLPEGWAARIQTHMQTGAPAYFRLRFDVRGLAPALVAAWANLRARLFSLPYGDQALLISRDDYDAVGGYRDIPLMEDVAIARALGRRLVALPMPVTTSAAKYLRDGWLKRGARNLSLLGRYFLGADPARLLRKY